MKCPECGEEMEEGFVQAASHIFWNKARRKIILGFSDDILDDHGEIMLASTPTLIGWLCRGCRLVVARAAPGDNRISERQLLRQELKNL